MTERELELRLEAVAVRLDARAPAFDSARLSDARPRRVRREIVLLACVVALVAIAAAPAAVSALLGAFEVVEVPTLGPLEPGVAPAFAGRSVPLSRAQASSSFGVRVIRSLVAPDEARVRDDITGGMVTIVYRTRGILLTQWRSTDVNARIALVPTAGRAEDVVVDGGQALWIEGAARGTFTLIGADGAVHRESFEVSPGALLWRSGGMSFLLQGAGSKLDAARLVGDVGRP
jgi:hypothetical protein